MYIKRSFTCMGPLQRCTSSNEADITQQVGIHSIAAKGNHGLNDSLDPSNIIYAVVDSFREVGCSHTSLFKQ